MLWKLTSIKFMCSSENVQLFCCTNYTIHSTKSHTEGCNCCLLSRFHYIAGLNQYIYTCCQQIRRYSDSFAHSQMKLFAFYAHEHYDKQLVMANNPSHEALMWYCFSFCWDVKGKKKKLPQLCLLSVTRHMTPTGGNKSLPGNNPSKTSLPKFHRRSVCLLMTIISV